MDADVGMKSKPFTYQRGRFDLIFSYCLAHGEDPLHESDFRTIVKQGEQWTTSLPDDRKGAISPFLALDVPRAFKQILVGDALIEQKRVKVSALFRLFPVGGTLTLTFEFGARGKEPLTTKHLHELLAITGTSYGTKATNIDFPERTYASAYHLFSALLKAECASLREKQGIPVSWYDKHESTATDGLIPQSPWLVTSFEVDGEVADAFCAGTDGERVMTGDEKSARIAPYLHDIGPILFRSISGHNFPVEPTYRGPEGGMDASLGNRLSSMHLDARMFVCSSRRNVLCVTRKLDADPASYFLPGVLGINELVRARWHALIVLNRNLDQVLRSYTETRDVGDEESQDKVVSSRRAIEKVMLKRIIRSRRWTTRVLDDQGIYLIAGDALASLYARGKEIFGLDELMTLLIRKSELVDRLHSDEQQKSWIERT